MSYMRNTVSGRFVGPIIDDGEEYEFLKGLKQSGSIHPLFEDVSIEQVEDFLGEDLDTSNWQCFCKVYGGLTVAEDYVLALGNVNENGNMSLARVYPNAAVAGAATNSRTLSVVDTTGPSTLASLALVAGVNLVARAENDITNGTVAVVAGDPIQYKSTHVGTGLVGGDPGGLVIVTFNEPTPTALDYSDTQLGGE